MKSAIGTPMTFSITTPTTSPETMGMMMIGMIGRRYLWTGIFLSRLTTCPASSPTSSAPRNPALVVPAR